MRRYVREAIDQLEPDEATLDRMWQAVVTQVEAARGNVPRRRASLHTGSILAALTIAALRPVLFPIVALRTLVGHLRSARQALSGGKPAARLEQWLVHAATQPVIGGVRLAMAWAAGHPRRQA